MDQEASEAMSIPRSGSSLRSIGGRELILEGRKVDVVLNLRL